MYCGQLLTGTALALTVGAGTIDAKPTNDLRAFRPVADTYVSAAWPETNFGALRSLRADGSPRQTAYLRFQLRKLSGPIASVVLLLRPTTGVSTSFQVRPVADNDWEEDELTFENAPKASLRYAASKPVRRGIWSAVDVTSFVTEDEGSVSFAITTRGARGVAFGSRESRRGPRLVVRTKGNGRDKSSKERP